MSGVWVFNTNGVIRLIENPQAESQGSSSSRRKVLVHLPTGEVVSSYSSLEQILTGLGWERYYGGDPDLFQFHKHSSIDLISLPRDFSKFNSVYMYDIVIKNPNVFHVRDMELGDDSYVYQDPIIISHYGDNHDYHEAVNYITVDVYKFITIEFKMEKMEHYHKGQALVLLKKKRPITPNAGPLWSELD
ncbi:hypothetical protein WN943_000104 [Citrus x changshan-huyou]